MADIAEGIIAVLIIAVFVTILVFAWSLVIWWAWNLVMPFLFHLPTISILQAFALGVLTSLLFGRTSRTSKD